MIYAKNALFKINAIAQDKKGKNLFNLNARNIGYYVNESNGNLVAFATYDTSDFIPVVAGVTYATTRCKKMAFYDTNKNYISGSSYSPIIATTVTAPADGYMRLTFEVGMVSLSQVEVGNKQTYYEPYAVVPGLSDIVQVPAIGIKGLPLSDIVVEKNGELFTIISDFDEVSRISIETSRNGSNNGTFRFLQTKLNSDIIHATSDDITPIRTFTAVGANHGYPCIISIIMMGHDKTTADLGSIWTDGTTIYTLLAFHKDNSNILLFGCPYTETDGIVSSSAITPVAANLTHVSGATHTTAVVVTIFDTTPQLHPSVNNISVEYLLDGKKIDKDGTYVGKELQVLESYNVMDYKAIIDYAQSNIGQSYINDQIAGVVRLAVSYTFTRGGKCFISHSFRALRKLSVLNCGFLQSVIISLDGYTVKRYMPNVAIKGGIDFKNIVDMTSYTTSTYFYPEDYIDPTKPPNRYIDLMYDSGGNLKTGYTMGYLIDKSNTKNEDRAAMSQGWDMRSTKKSYPVAMTGITLNAGDYKTFMGYRNYISPYDIGNATNFNVVRDKKDTYIYIDYHASISYGNVKLPDDIGKSITIIDSENFTLHSDIVDCGGVTFSIINDYGYAVLKLS